MIYYYCFRCDDFALLLQGCSSCKKTTSTAPHSCHFFYPLPSLLFRKLDQQLDQIGQGVARLKNIALDMNTEIKTQVCYI